MSLQQYFKMFSTKITQNKALSLGITVTGLVAILSPVIINSIMQQPSEGGASNQNKTDWCQFFSNSSLVVPNCDQQNLTDASAIFISICQEAFRKGYEYVNGTAVIDISDLVEKCQSLPSAQNITDIDCDKAAQAVCLSSAWAGYMWNSTKANLTFAVDSLNACKSTAALSNWVSVGVGLAGATIISCLGAKCRNQSEKGTEKAPLLGATSSNN
jgi:hypothetical protein